MIGMYLDVALPRFEESFCYRPICRNHLLNAVLIIKPQPIFNIEEDLSFGFPLSDLGFRCKSTQHE